jgi:hypothetical protein
MDGSNDGPARLTTGVLWATSVLRADKHTPNSWHWPEFVQRTKKESTNG